MKIKMMVSASTKPINTANAVLKGASLAFAKYVVKDRVTGYISLPA